jgi:hypothetical protein
MKKKILILLTVLLIIIVAAIIYLGMNLNSLISRFKPDLEKIASDTMGMPVKFGNLEASVFPETQIIVKELKLGGMENTQAFKLDSLRLNVKLASLIFSQKLEITKLTINSPEIIVNKSAEGIDISGVPKKQHAPKIPNADSKSAAGSASPIAISLNSLEVEKAKLLLLNFVKDKELTLSDVDIKAAIAIEGSTINVNKLALDGMLLGKSKLSLSTDSIIVNNSASEIKIPAVKAKLNGDEINLSATYDMARSALDSKLTSERVDLEKLLSLFSEFVPPAVSGFNIKGAVKPALNVKTVANNFNADGTVGVDKFSAEFKTYKISDLSSNLQLKADNTRQNIKAPDLALTLNGNPVKITADTTLALPELEVTNLLIKAFSGEVLTTGKLLIETPVSFNLQNQIAHIQVESALNALKPGPAMISGTLEKAAANLSGTLDANLVQSLNGSVSYILTNGELKGFNIGSKVLKAVNNLSFLSGSLYERVQGKKELFDVANTVFKKCTANISVGGGSMNTKDLFLASPTYDLDAAGRIGFDASLDLKANIKFTPDISAMLLSSVKELKSALDENSRLNIPLALQGVPPAIIVTPDVKKLIELGAKSYLRDKATDLLEGAIRRKANGGSSGGLGKLLGF